MSIRIYVDAGRLYVELIDESGDQGGRVVSQDSIPLSDLLSS